MTQSCMFIFRPVPPGPQLSTARRAARQRAMIRQKQRAGDSDGVGQLSDESPVQSNGLALFILYQPISS